MYLIINDIYSIYFPYFRLFLNCLLVDKYMDMAHFLKNHYVTYTVQLRQFYKMEETGFIRVMIAVDCVK